MKHAVQQFAVTFQAAHLALGAAAQVVRSKTNKWPAQACKRSAWPTKNQYETDS
jgi:hypothetical protein